MTDTLDDQPFVDDRPAPARSSDGELVTRTGGTDGPVKRPERLTGVAVRDVTSESLSPRDRAGLQRQDEDEDQGDHDEQPQPAVGVQMVTASRASIRSSPSYGWFASSAPPSGGQGPDGSGPFRRAPSTASG